MTGEAVTPSDNTLAYQLHGWDDEKIYLYSKETGERCVSDEPELLHRLTEICVEYFAKQAEGEKG